MLSENLDDYMEQSVPFHEAKFNEMMKNMNIKLKPASNPPSFDGLEILKAKKCDKVCQNDTLWEELDEFFNSMKKTSVQQPNTSNSSATVRSTKSADEIATKTVKISVDESNGDLIFDTNFRRNRYNDQSSQNIGRQFPVSSPFGLNSNRNVQNRKYSENSNNNYTMPATTTSNDNHMPFGPVKRKPSDSGNDFFKKPTYNTNKMPVQSAQSNPFQLKSDFKSATEELMFQYNKKHQAGASASSSANQDDNFSYNTHPDGGLKRSLGGRRTIHSQYVPPFANNSDKNSTPSPGTQDVGLNDAIDTSHPRLKNVDAKMIETISNEIMDQCDRVGM